MAAGLDLHTFLTVGILFILNLYAIRQATVWELTAIMTINRTGIHAPVIRDASDAKLKEIPKIQRNGSLVKKNFKFRQDNFVCSANKVINSHSIKSISKIG